MPKIFKAKIFVDFMGRATKIFLHKHFKFIRIIAVARSLTMKLLSVNLANLRNIYLSEILGYVILGLGCYDYIMPLTSSRRANYSSVPIMEG